MLEVRQIEKVFDHRIGTDWLHAQFFYMSDHVEFLFLSNQALSIRVGSLVREFVGVDMLRRKVIERDTYVLQNSTWRIGKLLNFNVAVLVQKSERLLPMILENIGFYWVVVEVVDDGGCVVYL